MQTLRRAAPERKRPVSPQAGAAVLIHFVCLQILLLWPLFFDPSPRCEEQNRNLCQLCRVLRRQTFGVLNFSQASAALNQTSIWFRFSENRATDIGSDSNCVSLLYFIHIKADSGDINPLSPLPPKNLPKRRSERLYSILKKIRGKKKQQQSVGSR